MTKIRFANNDDLIALNQLLSNFKHKTDLNLDYDKYLVIEEESLIGFLNYYKLYDKIEIQYIFVEKNYRNKGYATDLLNFLSNEEKYSSITLEVKVTNDKAIKLYLKNKFEVVAKREKYYDGIDGYLMSKSG